MTVTASAPEKTRKRPPRGARQVGYLLSAAINLVLLWVVSNLLQWDWLPFLTEEFDLLVPVVSFSLILSAAINLAYFFFDPKWFKTLGDTINAMVALIVIVRTYQVFPFEFVSGFWTGAFRVGLVVVGVAVAIAIVAQTIQLLTGKIQDTTAA